MIKGTCYKELKKLWQKANVIRKIVLNQQTFKWDGLVLFFFKSTFRLRSWVWSHYYCIPPHQNGCIYLRNERKKNAKNQRINWIQTKFSVLNEWFVLSEEVILLENFVEIFHSVKKLMQSSVNILKMKNVSRNLTKNFYKTQKVFYFLELVLSLHFLSERTGKKENWYLKK